MCLSLEDQLATIEHYVDDCGMEDESVTLANIRTEIEGKACYLIFSIAEQKAREAFQGLEELMDDSDFEFSDLVLTNRYSWARHYAEREEEDAQVYEYRNIEGEVHVDVWEYVLCGSTRIYLERLLDESDVPIEEQHFDAS